MSKTFRAYDLNQLLLLPPDLRQWLPGGHLALYVSDVVDALDLSAIMSSYEEGDLRGRPPYHPAMMVKLLIYGYCVGKMSSRKIERATYDDVGFRVLSGNQQPDHDSIAEFRKRQLQELGQLFVQVLQLCQRAGLVKPMVTPSDGSVRAEMWQKLKSPPGRALYNRRKVIVEPVFAHIKHLRGFRQLLLRGLEKVEAEWLLICLTHNLLKLFRVSKPLPAS